jgi:arylsulfatase A-like enzyme
LYDNALIILVSDHGEEFYDHGGWWHGQTLYDELIRVPMAVKLPGNLRAGELNRGFARLIDVAPTMLVQAGAAVAPGMQGRSLFTQEGQDVEGGRGFIYAESDFEGIVLDAVRTHEHKLIHANEGNKRDIAPVEFYDLSADPEEQQNIAGSAPEAVIDPLAELMDEMTAYIEENAKEPMLADEVPAEIQEQMDSLGYL